MAERAPSLFLACCLLATTAACQSAADRSLSHRERVRPGLMISEVEDRLGPPSEERYEAGIRQWVYSYGPGLGRGAADVVALVVGGLIIAIPFMAMARLAGDRGGGSTVHLGSPWDRSSFVVEFGSDQRVARIYFRGVK